MDKQKRLSFSALQVKQKNFTFYLASLRAGDIIDLYAPLYSGSQNSVASVTVSDGQPQDEASGQQYIKATLPSNFEEEVVDVETHSYDEDSSFQRLLDRLRARKISDYLGVEDALLPNAVILASRETADVEVRLIDASPGSVASVFFVTLTWQEDIPLNIIDGQHRLEALKMLIREDAQYEDFMLPATLLIDFPYYMQAELFSVINGEQKAVNRSQIYDLLGYLPLKDPLTRQQVYEGELKVHRFSHNVVKVLNNSISSPWHSKIKMRGIGQGVVTQASFVDHLVPLINPRKETKSGRNLPVLYLFLKTNDLVGIARVVVIYFRGIKEAWPKYWVNDADLKASLFGQTNGVAITLRILQDLAVYLGGADKITHENVAELWRNAPEERLTTPPETGGRSVQELWYRSIMEGMLGGNFEEEINQRSFSVREDLRNIGGLF